MGSDDDHNNNNNNSNIPVRGCMNDNKCGPRGPRNKSPPANNCYRVGLSVCLLVMRLSFIHPELSDSIGLFRSGVTCAVVALNYCEAERRTIQ